MLEDGRTYHSEVVESRTRRSGLSREVPTPTNVDDSIVLSDLVRSGEASRLRRRGAMRLDRNSLASGHAHHHRHLTFDSEFDDESHSDGWTSRPHSRWLGGVESDEEAEYVLVCGAEVEGDGCSDDHSGPYEPSILPIEHTQRAPRPTYSRPTNGCGALVHLNGRRGPGKTYIARGSATDSVVQLDSEYFDSYPGVKFESSSCGCVKEGVGCAVCGNALGTRWRLCKAMASSQRKDSWGAEGQELFTFFATAVTVHRDETYSDPSPPAATLSAKPSQEWRASVTPPPRYPEDDWLGTMSNHYEPLAINVEVTVASSISYSERHHSLADLSSTTSTVEAPQRPPLFPSQSAPAALFAYHLTDSPESISQPLPDEVNIGPIVQHSPSDSSSSGSWTSEESFGVREFVRDAVSEPYIMDSSEESYAYPGMTLYEQQIAGGAASELSWEGEWPSSSSSGPSAGQEGDMSSSTEAAASEFTFGR